jgi:adenylate kinase family enzyme
MSIPPPPGKRISVRGTSGSGKSTMGHQLAEIYQIPFIELDAINHQANWKEIEVEEFRARVRDVVAGDAWVIDGNYAKVRDLVLERCDTVVWLDYSLPTVLARLTKRTFRRWYRKEELWHGNRESLWTHLFTRDSLFYWVLTTHRRRRADAQAFLVDPAYEGKLRIRLQDPREAALWIQSLREAAKGSKPVT